MVTLVYMQHFESCTIPPVSQNSSKREATHGEKHNVLWRDLRFNESGLVENSF